MADGLPPPPPGAIPLPPPPAGATPISGTGDAPPQPPLGTLQEAGNAAARAVGGSLINAVTFIPDLFFSAANLGGGLVDKAAGIQEPDIELPSSYWQHQLDKVTRPPTTMFGKAAEGISTAVGGGMLGGLATGAEKLGAKAVAGVEGLMQRGLRTAEKEAPLNRVRTKAAEQTMTAGYNLTPAYVGGEVKKGLQTAVGKAATHRAASLQNEPISDGLAALSLGLHPKTELTPEVLDGLEKEAFQEYSAVRELGRMGRDTKFEDAIRGAGERFRLAPRERGDVWTPGEGFSKGAKAPEEAYSFPGISELKAKYLDSDVMDSKRALDDVRSLRYSSRLNLTGMARPEDRALGYVQRQIADALEDRIGRFADASKKPDLLRRLQTARIQLAKVNTVRDVLVGGHIRPSDLYRINKAHPGMLTDGLLTIAKTAEHFGKDVELVSIKGEEGSFSVVDYLLGGSGILSGHPGVAGLSLARPLIKKTLLSERSQRDMLNNLGKWKPPSEGAKTVRKTLSGIGRAGLVGGSMQGVESELGDLGDNGP